MAAMNKTDENWAQVYSSQDEAKADILIDSLDQAGIKAVKMNKRDSSFPIGNIEVYVRLEDLCVAKNIIKEFEQ